MINVGDHGATSFPKAEAGRAAASAEKACLKPEACGSLGVLLVSFGFFFCVLPVWFPGARFFGCFFIEDFGFGFHWLSFLFTSLVSVRSLIKNRWRCQ
jgi:hypothetical protein